MCQERMITKACHRFVIHLNSDSMTKHTYITKGATIADTCSFVEICEVLVGRPKSPVIRSMPGYS